MKAIITEDIQLSNNGEVIDSVKLKYKLQNYTNNMSEYERNKIRSTATPRQLEALNRLMDMKL